MNKGIVLILALIAFTGIACKRGAKTIISSSGVYKGVVLRSICCQDVVQAIGGDTLGQDTWIDSSVTPLAVYHHVFKVSNPCQFGNHVQGDTINFTIVAQQAQTCACCMLFVFTPNTTYPIQVLN